MVTHYLLFLISNELPAQVKQRVDHACAGDIAAPKILHYQMRRLANINYIIPVKAALHMMGLYFPHPLFRTGPLPELRMKKIYSSIALRRESPEWPSPIFSIRR